MANFWRHVKHYFTSGSGIRRLDLLILYVLFVFIGFLAFNAVQAGSERALKIAVSTRTEVAEHDRILSQFRSEKVCSDTNQGQACRDLFNRLRNNITDAQRFQLACMVLDQTKQKEVFDNIGCLPVPPGAKP